MPAGAGGAAMTLNVVRTSVDEAHGQSLASFADSVDSILLDNAVNALRNSNPEMSASSPLPVWQRVMLFGFFCAVPLTLPLVIFNRADWLAAGLAFVFSGIVLLRLAVLWHLIWQDRRTEAASSPIADDALPNYSVLVPLFKEAAVAPALVQAMSALDYPADKIDIIFITEEEDVLTRTALMQADLLPHMQILTVPQGLPQTKPRALNYALQVATGDIVVVYDAEDVPEPAQLRKAAACFANAGPDLVCVQARLSIYNPADSLLTKQFALEYAVLFAAILPALRRLGLPILLGGTSNHFRHAKLVEAGAWDPFNVTEDADLGVRLARLGYRVSMLDSDTWEEAPRTARAWIGQRTRWLKGWMQTYIVHMRAPQILLADLGAWRFLGVQVVLAGMILSALIHPWLYAAALLCLVTGAAIVPEGGLLWMVCWFNLVAGHAVGVLLGVIAAWRSQGRIPVAAALELPIYWLAISAGSYLALRDLYKRPFYWEKTPHGARRVTGTRAPSRVDEGALAQANL